MPLQCNHEHEQEITMFAETNFRNQKRRFGIKTDDRRRHVYIIGKTGMGKTTLMENMILADIYAGHGCCFIDPHGDTAERLVDFVPSARINDVVYFNPSDSDFPMGFNILEVENEGQKHLIVAGLMGVFKKIWPDVWSPRMEYILQNCVQALLDYPGATLLGINRLLIDKEYRAKVVAKIRDPVVKMFWVGEFPSWSEKYATEAIAPIQNKVGQFLSSPIIRNIVAQVKSTVNLKRVMDDGKILIVNLSKGRIGEDNMRLIGGMLITKVQLAAQERQNYISNELDRRDFYLYVDEFQNFANESFATILSEARKYRLNLIVAHQYIEQLDEKVCAAIFGNVGTIIVMRVGGADAAAMETEFTPTFTPEDLVSLSQTQIYLKLMVDGVATPPFSANTLPPIGKRTSSAGKVIAVSRERYAEPKAIIEEKVFKWSGMELALPKTESIAELSSTIEYLPIRTEEERKTLAEKEERTTTESVEYLTIKPERLVAIQSLATSQKKKEKPKFSYTCSRCGKTFFALVQLDPQRPLYCPDVCRPAVLEEKKKLTEKLKLMKQTLPPPEEAESIGITAQTIATQSHRPRIVRETEPEKKLEKSVSLRMADEILQRLPKSVQTDKTMIEFKAVEPKRPFVRDKGRKHGDFPSRIPRDNKRNEPRHEERRGASRNDQIIKPQHQIPGVQPSQEEKVGRSQQAHDEVSSASKSVTPGQRVRFDK